MMACHDATIRAAAAGRCLPTGCAVAYVLTAAVALVPCRAVGPTAVLLWLGNTMRICGRIIGLEHHTPEE
jgi:hypothetical protein